ncbi:MAG: tRNA (guanosine(37)-N1)-methyltransferase TrmD [Bacillota bacterium]|nr:tRNA (guanosine(37)-N1)-methyltransferase TrmD [Bacillota bacterium]
MRIAVLTLFPGMLEGFVRESILGRAISSGVIDIRLVNIRDFAYDKHQVTDDYPYGGGAGMVMKPEPLVRAIESVTAGVEPRPHVVLMTPQGRLFDQARAKGLARLESLVLVCGHYEGIDERVLSFADEELSIGNYVLTGGELAAAVVADAVARLVPGVISPGSSLLESFQDGILEGPQYTRPRDFRGMPVPEILVSGDHEKVRVWRRKEALRKTALRRPDLLAGAKLGPEDLKLLAEIEKEPEPEGL